MRTFLSILLFSSVCVPQLAQQRTPSEVPVENEPHHHLLFENEYVRVFKVEVAPHEATLVHRHKRDYVVVTIGDAEVTNAVVGKEPKKWSFKDGDVTFLEATGEKSFAHKAVNESAKPFVNYTIELKQSAKNPNIRGGGVGMGGTMTTTVLLAENVACGKVLVRDSWNTPARHDKPELAVAVQPREFKNGVGLNWLDSKGSQESSLFAENTGEKIFAFCEFR